MTRGKQRFKKTGGLKKRAATNVNHGCDIPGPLSFYLTNDSKSCLDSFGAGGSGHLSPDSCLYGLSPSVSAPWDPVNCCFHLLFGAPLLTSQKEFTTASSFLQGSTMVPEDHAHSGRIHMCFADMPTLQPGLF